MDKTKDTSTSSPEDDVKQATQQTKDVSVVGGAGYLARHDPDRFERLMSQGDYANEYD